MKKTLLTLCAFLLSWGMASAQTLASQAAGDYTGNLKIGLNEPSEDFVFVTDEEGNTIYDENEEPVLATFQVKIEAETDNTVKFGLYNFGFLGLELGDIVLPGIPVNEAEDGTIKFGDNEPQYFHFLPEMDGGIEATAKIGKESYIKDGHSNIDVEVLWLTTPENVPIFVRFVGDKEAAPAVPNDLNGDSAVNVGDVTTLVNIILGKSEAIEGTDLNNDGAVNVGDVTTLVNIILGK